MGKLHLFKSEEDTFGCDGDFWWGIIEMLLIKKAPWVGFLEYLVTPAETDFVCLNRHLIGHVLLDLMLDIPDYECCPHSNNVFERLSGFKKRKIGILAHILIWYGENLKVTTLTTPDCDDPDLP